MLSNSSKRDALMLGGTIGERYVAKMYKSCACGTVAHVPVEAILDSGGFYEVSTFNTLSCEGKCGRFWVWKT